MLRTFTSVFVVAAFVAGACQAQSPLAAAIKSYLGPSAMAAEKRIRVCETGATLTASGECSVVLKTLVGTGSSSMSLGVRENKIRGLPKDMAGDMISQRFLPQLGLTKSQQKSFMKSLSKGVSTGNPTFQKAFSCDATGACTYMLVCVAPSAGKKVDVFAFESTSKFELAPDIAIVQQTTTDPETGLPSGNEIKFVSKKKTAVRDVEDVLLYFDKMVFDKLKGVGANNKREKRPWPKQINPFEEEEAGDDNEDEEDEEDEEESARTPPGGWGSWKDQDDLGQSRWASERPKGGWGTPRDQDEEESARRTPPGGWGSWKDQDDLGQNRWGPGGWSWHDQDDLGSVEEAERKITSLVHEEFKLCALRCQGDRRCIEACTRGQKMLVQSAYAQAERDEDDELGVKNYWGNCYAPGGKTGTCININYVTCTGGQKYRGLCPGPNEVRCCVKPSGSTPAPRNYGSCNANGATGKCIDTNSESCSGGGKKLFTGLCPGSYSVKCCAKGGSNTGSGSSGRGIYTGIRGQREMALMNIAKGTGMRGAELNQFMAQCAHECDGFNTMEEYASGSAYEGRRDLGNTQPGDGRRYKGRGYIQITGRANYRTIGRAIGVDLENNPLKAMEPAIAAKIALNYWNTRVKPRIANFCDTTGVTRLINGGTNGLSDRQRKFSQYGGCSGRRRRQLVTEANPQIGRWSYDSVGIAESARKKILDKMN